MDQSTTIDIGLGLEGSHVMITGGAGQIGEVIVRAFLAAGTSVTVLDIKSPRENWKHERLLWIEVDVTNEEKLEQAFDQARAKFGTVSICCAAAGLDLSFIPHHQTICDLPLDQWQRTITVNTTGTFLTARAWLRGIKACSEYTIRNVSLIVIGSEAGIYGVPGNADYATSKSAIQYGLVKSLAPEAVRVLGQARVNAIAPGPVDTPQFRKECEADGNAGYVEFGATTALKSSVPMEAVARVCLMLASENYSSHVTGQLIPVDSGKSGKILWNRNGSSSW